MVFDIVGWIGTFLLVSAFFLVSTKKLPPTSVTYQLMNLFGSLGVGINVFVKGSYPGLIVEVAWAIVAIYTLVKIYTK